VVSTLAGSPEVSGATDGTGTTALFNVPDGIAVDQAGNLCVCDSANYTIRRGHIAALIQLAVFSGGVVLSWPAELTGYVCETSTNIAAGPWSLHTNGIFSSGDNLVQTNTPQAGSVFYRLHKP
jgi:secreted PhoX family phosphatase